MRRGAAIVAMVGAMLAAAACQPVGPDYAPPRTAVPPTYAELASSDARAPLSRTVPGEPDLSRWWQGFGDPVLSGLVERAFAGNPDLAVAASRIRQARAQVRVAGADALPSIGVNGDVNRTHLSKNAGLSSLQKLFGGGGAGGQGGGAGAGPPGGGFTTYTLGLDASWQPDLFGGVRRTVEAATDQAIAAVWSERDTRVTLAGQVADTYLGLRSLQQQLAVAEAERARQQELLAMIQARARAGFTTELDVAQQQTLVDSSAAPLPGLGSEIRARIHALGVLVGDAPDALAGELAAPAALPPVPPQIPVGLPSDLLRRRPDLRAAERQLAAATAEIGAATAELYPSISLTGAFSFVSTALKNLLSLSSRQYSGDAALRWPLLDGGRIRANIAVTKEQRAQAALTYRKTVLAALRDVEDALGFYAGEQQRNRALRRARDSGRAAVAVTQRQYQAGLADFSNVLNAQAALLNAENQLAQSDGAIDHDLVVLYEALGGGWVAGETGLVEEAGAVE